ncbi:prefoldin subunit beta [Candidatus Woesearchaeota archaeon]|nr:prefoldin subunit beta [Candidatus Woesearchaeota archaeon]
MASPDADTQAKIQQLQVLEQSVQNLNVQKQQFQMQLTEIESALEEIKGKDSAYKIVGNVMVSKPTKEIEDDLNNKRELINVRIKSLENQENKIKEKISATQKEVMSVLKK